ncbi:hypothetical protein AAY473_010580 [Plecturocebus cupreus]
MPLHSSLGNREMNLPDPFIIALCDTLALFPTSFELHKGLCRKQDLALASIDLGMVTHACNPSSLGGQGRRIALGQEFETSMGNMVLGYM